MTITLVDFYKEYSKKYKGTEFECTYREYKDIVSIILSQIMDVLFKGKTFEVPANLGDLVIGKKRQQKRPIDWQSTKKYGKLIYLNNIHSNNYVYKFQWLKSKKKFPNRKLYTFRPTRANAREVCRLAKNGELTVFYRI